MALAVIQARMGSTRLPGKVLRPLGPRTVLSWVIRAAQASGVFERVVVATTTEAADEAIAVACRREGAEALRGPVDDVLTRFLMATSTYPDDVVVRLTADCPLLDPAVISMAVRAFEGSPVDYLSTITPRSLPRGLDVEVFSTEALERAGRFAVGVQRTHVTPYLYSNPEEFRIAGITFTPPASDLRLTLDTAADGALLDAVVDEMGDCPPAWRDVVKFLRSRPDLVSLNSHVRQKGIEEG